MLNKNQLDHPDENLPGYSHDPSGEDLLAENKDRKQVDKTTEASPLTNTFTKGTELSQSSIDLAENSESKENPGLNDITKDDLLALGDENLASDGGEDEQLKDRVNAVDIDAGDLDIPGSELDDQMENIGSEDEENNYYSLGGDRHDK